MSGERNQKTDHGVFGDKLGQVIDREADFSVTEHSRPHWLQSGTITFITLRLADSIPCEVVERWDRDRVEFLRQHGIRCDDWRTGCVQLSERDRIAFDKQFYRLREDELDTCHGRCQLKDPRAAAIVAGALKYFDGDRYLMGDFVVMPNHAHLLAVFPDATTGRKQCYSWMKFTATQINRLNGSKGRLWQNEPFDHLVRSERQLQYLRDYIEQNPVKAKLRETEFYYHRSNRHF